MHSRKLLAAAAAGLALVATACGKKAESAAATNGSASGSVAAAAPTGKTIEVKLITDEQGNRFEPADFEAHRGDVLRFTLVAGAHNVHFLPDSNPGKSGLPPASDILQLPGQTLDVPVTFAPGKYYFQCDPHALLGMKGHLKVEAADDKDVAAR